MLQTSSDSFSSGFQQIDRGGDFRIHALSILSQVAGDGAGEVRQALLGGEIGGPGAGGGGHLVFVPCNEGFR